MTNELRVAIWHNDHSVRATLSRAIESMGYEVSEAGSDGEKLIEHALSDSTVRLIICGMTLGQRDGVPCLLQIAQVRPIPAIVVTDDRSLAAVEKALEDHVMAYLVEPIRIAEIKPTIYLVLKRFEQFNELQEEVQDLKETLDARKKIERAKAVIMRRSDVDEDESYQRLRRLAMDGRMKMVEAAQKILDVESAYGKSS